MLFAQALGIEPPEEAFHSSVVPADATTALAANNAVRFKQAPEVLARVLGSLVRMMQHSARPATCDAEASIVQ